MNLGVIGTGKIVTDALYAMKPIEEIRPKAILSRPHSLEKGRALAYQYAIDPVYTDYDELLSRPDIDTVYIGLINSVHYAFAKQALEAGKHVILEKPFTGTLAEAEDLFELADKKGLFLFEAITVLHNDVIGKMRSSLPKLGKIRMMCANFSQYSSRYDQYLAGDVTHTFDPENKGGSMRDMNVYNLHYAAALFGMPEAAHYYAALGYNGVDTSGVLVLEYDGFSAVCIAAKDSDSPCFVTIQGESGYMQIDGKPNLAPNLTIVTVGSADGQSKKAERDASGAVVRTTVSESFTPGPEHHRMTREFRDFVRIIEEKDCQAAKLLADETLTVMKVLEMIG